MIISNDANVYLPGVITTPSSLQITDITQEGVMKVTVQADPITASIVYHINQTVKFFIPFEYGMQQLNGRIGKIILIDDDDDDSDFYINIDSRNFDPFQTPAGNITPASLAPYGCNNLEYNNTTNQVPYQSLDNGGN